MVFVRLCIPYTLSLTLSFSHCLQSPSSVTDDLPRIAQLQNEIENRDKALLQCKKENDALKVQVRVNVCIIVL